MNTLRAWREKGAVRFLAHVTVTGTLAGFLAWLLVLGIRSLGVGNGSGGTGLSSALFRGTLVGLAVGLLLEIRWRVGGRGP